MEIPSSYSGLRRLVADGRALLGPISMSRSMQEYLLTLPWTGSAPDWTILPHVVFGLAHSSARDFETWLRTWVPETQLLAVVYDAAAPCAVLSLKDFAEHFDELFLGAPGAKFCAGVVADTGSEMRLVLHNVIVYDGADTLRIIAESRR